MKAHKKLILLKVAKTQGLGNIYRDNQQLGKIYRVDLPLPAPPLQRKDCISQTTHPWSCGYEHCPFSSARTQILAPGLWKP